MRRLVLIAVGIALARLACGLAWTRGAESRTLDTEHRTLAAGRKTASVFFPAELVARARKNAQVHPWAAQARDRLVAAAVPWVKLSDDALWDLMFANSIKRSWMVWSNGHCPACQKPVPMYEWISAPLERPWKMQCPQCRELFPKNDFAKFYRSGLNEQGLFEPSRADRKLLFNAKHPDPADPQHRFGVDDGDGYVDGAKRWRFIGAYLIYGQWKQAIVGGIRNLAAAYLVTGEPAYAHKAGVLLDRVADVYPTFDFGKEGVMYEGPPHTGYVSTWHDAAVEAYELATAYDAVFEALGRDESLVKFLADKAQRHKLANAKSSFADVQQNIEERILRDTVTHRRKIESNYPSTDITIAAILTVLGWPENRDAVTAILDRIIQRATAVDGLSGEKGIAGYSTIAPRTIAELLGRYGRMDPKFLAAAVQRHPQLRAMYRFHLDTWCLGQYYPCTGDTGAFAQKVPQYPAVSFSRATGIEPSAFTFLWDLHAATGDKDFVRLLYAANGNQVAGLPHDLFHDDPADFQRRVAKIITEEGAAIQVGSVNKPQWCLGILRSGEGADARAAWLDYDSGGGHGHADALNLGLFAHGLDLMPDCGYPPVQYGGWGAPRAVWYTRTAAHNTVVVDGQNTRGGRGTATLWAEGKQVQAIRASCAALIGGRQYERTAVLVDLSPRNSYVVDVFRVVGGREHTKFMHSHFGQITPQGLSLQPAEETAWGAQMRGFRRDANPPPIWSVDWRIDDHLKYLPPGKEVHVRYTDLTADSEVLTAEGWVAVGLYGGTADAWIPRVLVRRRAAEAPLASTFVSVIEPYEKQPGIADIRRLGLETAAGQPGTGAGPQPRSPVSPRPGASLGETRLREIDAELQQHRVQPCSEWDVALEIRLASGGRDVLVAIDAEHPQGPARPAGTVFVQKESGVRLDGQLSFVRFDAAGKPQRVVLCQGKSLEVGPVRIGRTVDTGWAEVEFNAGRAAIVSGTPSEVEAIFDGGQRLWPGS